MVLEQFNGEAELLGQLVPVALENGPDLLHALKAGPVSDTALCRMAGYCLERFSRQQTR